MRALAALALASGLASMTHVAAGCGGRSAPPPVLESRTIEEHALAVVPADTPYVFVSLGAPKRAPLLPSTKSLYESIAKADKGGSSTGEQLVRRVLAELKDGERYRTARELGFVDDGSIVLYGLSLWPVARFSIGDGKILRGVVGRIIADVPGVHEQRRGRTILWIAKQEKLAVVAAIVDRSAVLALLPAAQLELALPYVLGERKPSNNLSNERRIERHAARYGFLTKWFGYIESKKVLELLAGGGSGFERELGALWQRDMVAAMATCERDFRRVAAAFPRLVMGYRRFDEHVADGSIIVEAPAIGSSLAQIRGEVPELVSDSDRPLFAFSIATDVGKLVEWARVTADELRADPFTCPGLSELATVFDQMSAGLGGVGMLHSLRGVAVAVDDITLEPKSGTGSAVIIGDQMQMLVALVWNMLQTGTSQPALGVPVAVSLQQLGLPSSASAHAALGTERFAVAVGPDSHERVSDTLAASTRSRPPLAELVIDVRRADALGFFEGKDRSDLENVERMKMSFDANQRGLVLDFKAVWKQPR